MARKETRGLSKIAISWQPGPAPGHEVNLLPPGLPHRRFDWQVAPWPSEGGMPEPIVAVLADVLAAQGPVVGHWAGAPPPHATLFPAPRRGWARRLWDRVLGRWVSDVLLGTRPATVALLIDAGWAAENQVLLALRAGRDPSPAVSLLAQWRDWREVVLPDVVRVLLLPGADGDSVLMAAADPAELEVLVDALGAAFREAGW